MNAQEEAKRRFREKNGYEYGARPVTQEQLEAVKNAIASRDESTGGKDYMQLVEEYRQQKNCSITDALMAINKKFPEARMAYIKKANPHIQ